MIGYKVFKKDFTDFNNIKKDKVFSVKNNPTPITPTDRFFQFFKKFEDIFKIFDKDDDIVVYEIKVLGGTLEIGDYEVYYTNKIKIIKKINISKKMKEIKPQLITNENRNNVGYDNTGWYNTGDENDGDYNTGNNNNGDNNVGNWNTGSHNTGYCNKGRRNTGSDNVGNWNTGNYNTGDYNTGHYNDGNYNVGSCNKGEHNIGNFNAGNYNIGDYNSGNFILGFFNTESRKISLFNHETDLDIDSPEINKLLDILVDS